MIDLFRTPFITDTKSTFVTPDYDGISKILAQFVELYKVCDNKEHLDSLLEYFIKNHKIVVTL